MSRSTATKGRRVLNGALYIIPSQKTGRQGEQSRGLLVAPPVFSEQREFFSKLATQRRHEKDSYSMVVTITFNEPFVDWRKIVAVLRCCFVARIVVKKVFQLWIDALAARQHGQQGILTLSNKFTIDWRSTYACVSKLSNTGNSMRNCVSRVSYRVRGTVLINIDVRFNL